MFLVLWQLGELYFLFLFYQLSVTRLHNEVVNAIFASSDSVCYNIAQCTAHGGLTIAHDSSVCVTSTSCLTDTGVIVRHLQPHTPPCQSCVCYSGELLCTQNSCEQSHRITTDGRNTSVRGVNRWWYIVDSITITLDDIWGSNNM